MDQSVRARRQRLHQQGESNSLPHHPKHPALASCETNNTVFSTLNFNVSSWTPFSLLPTFTAVANASDGLNLTVIPYANGTFDDCARYISAPFVSNYSTNTTSSSCADAAAQFGVDLSDFISWNPSLNTSTGSNCTLQPGYDYCVRTYDLQNDATQYCSEWEITQSGFGCQEFANLYGIEVDQFVLWNPEVGSDCSNFTMGGCFISSTLDFF